ncbi:MAG: SAM-dependent methyltransferase [Desulfoplanes sp.]|nr:SAM-dependent methyltransferase [Desulfoplanes sp.]
MSVVFEPIGFVQTQARTLPRHWSVSDVEGDLVLDASYIRGLDSMSPGDRIVVLFHFHESPPFSMDSLMQRPPHGNQGKKGVFCTCSPYRPNAIGFSIVTVLALNGNSIRVRGIDMRNGTPILDIKPDVRPS